VPPHRDQLRGVLFEFLHRLLDRLALVGRLDFTKPFGGGAKRLPGTPCRRADWGPSFVMFVAQLEPTAAEPEAAVTKSTAEAPAEPEAAVTKSTAEAPAEPEAAVTKSTAEAPAEPETAVAKFTAAEPEATVEPKTALSKSTVEAKAAPAEAASAKADHVNVGPTPPSAGNGRLTLTSAGNGRRTQRRAGCGDRRGDQTNRYLAHHDAHFHSF
jgi:hypothetical protein